MPGLSRTLRESATRRVVADLLIHHIEQVAYLADRQLLLFQAVPRVEVCGSHGGVIDTRVGYKSTYCTIYIS